MSDSPPLVALLQAHLQAHGPITFAEYMDWVLYHPGLGYYSRGAGLGGAGQDFYTSSHVGPEFGALLAAQFIKLWQELGQPDAFTVVEMGAGQGIFAEDVLNYWVQQAPDFYKRANYIIVERSEQLQKIQQQRLGQRVTWRTLGELTSIKGCFFANELVDAFPVHRVIVCDGELQELYVTADFQEVVGPLSTPRLGAYFQLVGVDISAWPEGYQSEVNLAALDWIQQVATCLEQGYVLTIDYGYPAHRYYQPSRSTGTLLAYYQHTTHTNFYQHIGDQDLTAHVDFTALERYGAQWDLTKLDFTQQGLLLMGLGLGEQLARLRESDIPLAQSLPRYQSLQHLMSPTGLGGFGVLLQGKGLTPQQMQYRFYVP